MFRKHGNFDLKYTSKGRKYANHAFSQNMKLHYEVMQNPRSSDNPPS